MIERNIEKALYLRRVQVHGEHPVGARGGDEVGYEFRRNGIARTRFSVLTRISEIRDDGGDTPRACPSRRVDHDQKFHQVIVDGSGRGLDDEQIPSAHRFVDVHADFAVAELAYVDAAQFRVQLFGDRLRQRAVGIAGEKFDLVAVSYHVYLQ